MLPCSASIFFVTRSERKNCSAGFCSKMSCNTIPSHSVMGDSVILAVKQTPFTSIAQFSQRIEDNGESLPLGVTDQPSDVLQDHNFRLFSLDNSSEVKENCSPSFILKTLANSCNGKWLATEASDKPRVVSNFTCICCCDVSMIHCPFIIIFRKFICMAVNFKFPHTLETPDLLKGFFYASHTSES